MLWRSVKLLERLFKREARTPPGHILWRDATIVVIAMSEFTQITLKSLQMSIPKLSRGFEQMPKMLMRICSNMHRHLYKKHVKHHEKIMQDLSQIGPKPFQNLLNSSLRSFWDVFGAISRPGRLQDSPRLWGDCSFWRRLAENWAPRDHFWFSISFLVFWSYGLWSLCRFVWLWFVFTFLLVCRFCGVEFCENAFKNLC